MDENLDEVVDEVVEETMVGTGLVTGFRKLYEDSILPIRSTKSSAGYDLYAHEEKTIKAGERGLVKIGVACKMEDNDSYGEYLAVVPRSGMALKMGVTVLNAPGIVDADFFPNEIGVILYNSSDEDFDVNIGDRIAQGILCRYEKFQDDNAADASRESGFGSTGM